MVDSARSTQIGHTALSFWHDTVGDLSPRPGLDGDTDADVAIVGGGLTGLWTAWYLLERDPALRIVVLEKEIAGFGASGRNGGWCSALFPRSTASLERAHGRPAALAMRRAMIDTIDEVGSFSSRWSFDFARGGTIAYARSAVQERAARAEIAEADAYGVDEIGWRGRESVGAAGALGASFDRSCASLHPAKLVRGLAAALSARGVRIVEGTEVTDVSPGRVTTARGVVTADRVVVATEGYTATFPATRRRILPLYSLMIATEPLPAAFWDEVQIAHGETFTDYRHLLIDGHFSRVTTDHSVVQEMVDAGLLDERDAENHPDSNVITRAVGFRDDPRPDVWMLPVRPGMRLLLCSDGLTKEVSDKHIKGHLSAGTSAAETADELMDAALAAGGRDNITVVVIDVAAAVAKPKQDAVTSGPSSGGTLT